MSSLVTYQYSTSLVISDSMIKCIAYCQTIARTVGVATSQKAMRYGEGYALSTTGLMSGTEILTYILR